MSARSALRSRFDFVPGESRQRPVRTGLIALAVLAFVLYCGFTASIPFLPKGGTVVHAEFARNVNVRSGTPVRVHGVDVGEVEKVASGPGHRGARLTMRIKSGMGVHVHSDARAGIYWRTLLGRNMYIDLDPGTPSAPPLGGAVIPVARTTTQVELDELVSVLDQTGRRAVQTQLREFDRGFSDPRAAAGTLDALAPAMRPVAAGLGALRGTQEGDLTTLVRETSRALGGLARDSDALAGLVGGAETTLGTVAARRADLGATLEQAPGSLRQTRASMARLHTTLDALDPLAGDLRPGARRLGPAVAATRPTLAALDRLLDRAEPLFDDLRPTAARLGDLAADGRPLVRDAAAPIHRTKEQIIPFLNERDRSIKLKNYEAIGPTMSAVASATDQFDAMGHVIRFQGGGSEQAVGPNPCTTYFLDPTAKQKVDCSLIVDALKQALGFGRAPAIAHTSGKRGRR